MKFDVIIPQWNEGKPLTVTNITADNEDEAKQKASVVVGQLGASIPIEVMTAKLVA